MKLAWLDYKEHVGPLAGLGEDIPGSGSGASSKYSAVSNMNIPFASLQGGRRRSSSKETGMFGLCERAAIMVVGRVKSTALRCIGPFVQMILSSLNKTASASITFPTGGQRAQNQADMRRPPFPWNHNRLQGKPEQSFHAPHNTRVIGHIAREH